MRLRILLSVVLVVNQCIPLAAAAQPQQPSNHAPVAVDSDPPIHGGQVGEPLIFQVSATDPDGDRLTLRPRETTPLPEGVHFTTVRSVPGEITGEVSWTPSANQVGTHELRFLASDGTAKPTEIPATVLVSAPPIPEESSVPFESQNLLLEPPTVPPSSQPIIVYAQRKTKAKPESTQSTAAPLSSGFFKTDAPDSSTQITPSRSTVVRPPVQAASGTAIAPSTNPTSPTIQAPAPTTQGSVLQAITAKPDLRVRRIDYSPSEVTVGTQVTLQAHIDNVGSVPTPATQASYEIVLEGTRFVDPTRYAVPPVAVGGRATSEPGLFTPGQAGTYQLKVCADVANQVDEGSEDGPDKNCFTVPITVTTAPTTPLEITTISLPDATVRTPYTASLTATGGTPPYRWSVAPYQGSLPPNLRLDSATGTLSGVPINTTTSVFTLQVADHASPPASVTRAFTLRVRMWNQTPSITSVDISPNPAVPGEYLAVVIHGTGFGTTPGRVDVLDATNQIIGTFVGSDTGGWWNFRSWSDTEVVVFLFRGLTFHPSGRYSLGFKVTEIEGRVSTVVRQLFDLQQQGTLAAPTSLHPNRDDTVQLPSASSAVTLSWDSVPGGAARYAVRALDVTDPSRRAPAGTCQASPPYYFCADVANATSVSLPVQAGHEYYWLVYAVDANGRVSWPTEVSFVIPLVGPVPTPLGEQKTAVILVNFADDRREREPYSRETVAQGVFGNGASVSAYFREASYGKTWLSGEVFGWHTLPIPTCSSDIVSNLNRIQDEAIRVADAADPSIDFHQYARLLFILPLQQTCSLGYGYGGSPRSVDTPDGPINASTTWLDSNLVSCVTYETNRPQDPQCFNPSLIAHELGHSFGLGHAQSYGCEGDSGAQLPLNCVINEYGERVHDYGDVFDIMGYAYFYHVNAASKEQLGWLASSTRNPDQNPNVVIEVTQGGDYVLQPLEISETQMPPPRTGKALKIAKDRNAQGQVTSWYYLEYRQPIGFDAHLRESPQGVLIRFKRGAGSSPTYLIDSTPGDQTFRNAPLGAGQTFRDLGAGVTITTVTTSPEGATVRITLPDAPTITGLSVSRSNVPRGGTYTATFTGTNLTDQMWFDICLKRPGARVEDLCELVTNWQQGLVGPHVVPADAAPGLWHITAARAQGGPILDLTAPPVTLEIIRQGDNPPLDRQRRPDTPAPTSFTVTASAPRVQAGEALTVTWTAPAGRPPFQDLIGLYELEAGRYVWWQYTQGETAGSFSLRAPEPPGKEYEFHYVPDRGSEVVARSTPPVSVVVPPVPQGRDDAAFLAWGEIPARVQTGQRFRVTTLTMRNTGTTTWASDPATSTIYVLVASQPVWTTDTGTNKAPLPSAPVSPPDGTLVLTFDVTAPTTPGRYEFKWQMGREVLGVVTRFGQSTTPGVEIEVFSPTPSPTKPDLTVSAIDIHPAAPQVGDVLTITSTIANRGTAAAPATQATYEIHELVEGGSRTVVPPTAYAVDPLAVGSPPFTSPPGLFPVGRTATYTVRVCADSANQIDEGSEDGPTKNCFSRTVTVTPPPLPPDLAAILDPFSSPLTVGRAVTLPGRIRNVGQTTAPASQAIYEIRTAPGLGDPIGRAVGNTVLDVPRLAPAEERAVPWDFTPQAAGDYLVRLYTSGRQHVPDDATAENNCATQRLTVQRAPMPNLSVRTVTLSPPSPSAGALVSLTATVCNTEAVAAAASLARYYFEGPGITRTDQFFEVSPLGALSSPTACETSAPGAFTPGTAGRYRVTVCANTGTDTRPPLQETNNFDNCQTSEVDVAPGLTLTDVTPRTLTVGQTVTLTFTGARFPCPASIHYTNGTQTRVLSATSCSSNAVTLIDTVPANTPPGPYTVRIQSPDGSQASNPLPVTLLPATYKIEGQIRRNDSMPIAGASVRLDGAPLGGTFRQTPTDGTGTYTFPNLPDGSYTITPTVGGYTLSPPTRTVTLAGADGRADFTARLLAPNLSVRTVTVSPPSPSAGALVSLTATVCNTEAVAAAASLARYYFEGPGITRTDQFFEVSPLGALSSPTACETSAPGAFTPGTAGRYRVTVCANTGTATRPPLQETSNFDNCQTSEVDVAPGLTLTDVAPRTITAGQGEVLLTATGTNFQAGDWMAYAGPRNDQGQAEFLSPTQLRRRISVPRDFPPGSYTITVIRNPGSSGQLVSNGLPITVLPPATYMLSGQIRRTDSMPIAGASVRLDGAPLGGTFRQTPTDGTGTYTFPNLPDGLYNVTPTVGGYTLSPSMQVVILMAGQGPLVTVPDFIATLIPPAQPNLTVNTLWVTSGPPTANQPITFQATILNSGTAAAGASWTQYAFSGPSGERISGGYAPALAASGTFSASFTFTPTVPGPHAVNACVDVNYEVAETDETGTDNCRAIPVTVSPPPDTTPPTVQFLRPRSGETVGGTVAIEASVTDNVGVTRVEVYVNGTLSWINPPSVVYADSTRLPNGNHTLTIKAFDAAGNSAEQSITIRVAN